MSFYEIELKRIDKLVGEYCRNLAPTHIQNKLKYNCRVEGQNVFLYEERPRYDNPKEWLTIDFAKLRFIRRYNLWRLYWMRASGKWELYEPKSESKRLEALVHTIEQDDYGCFFG